MPPEVHNKRVFGLDLMRAIAIVTVVMGHGRMLDSVDTNFPWIRLPDGVELFFVLSGFLIGSILIKEFHEKSFGIRALWKFWIRRWFRTLPNYYLVLLLNVLVVYFGFTNENIGSFNWKFFLFLQNFSQPFTGFFWESWSLSIEEWFYIFFPILLSLTFLVTKSRITKKQVFITAITLFLLIPFFLRFFIASEFHVDQFWLETSIFKVVIFRLDGIALGLLAALISHSLPALWYKSRYISMIAGIAIIYTVLYSTWEPNHFNTKVFMPIIQGFGCFLLLPFFDGLRTAPRFILRPVTHISLISYSMYLLNLGLISSLFSANIVIQSTPQAWFYYALYWFLVIALSTMLYKYYEKPMMDLRDRVSVKKKQDQKQLVCSP